MSLPDVVFCVRELVRRDELQFALRGWAANVPHNKIWFVGGCPDWIQNVNHVPFPDGEDKWQGIADKFKFLATIDGLADEFYYTEDDYYVLKPFDRIPNYTHPTKLNARVAQYERERPRVRGKPLPGWTGYLQETRNVLRDAGFEDPESFDVHIPLLVEKDRIPLELDTGRPLSWRTLCGNTSTIPPTPAPLDVKNPNTPNRKKALEFGFLSSSEGSFRRIGMEARLQKMLPDYCRYEREF